VTISTPDLCDAFPDDVDVCQLQFRSFGKRSAFGGQIVTVKCYEDNSLVKEILATDGSGKVLVVDGGGSLRRALIGDQIGASAVKNHWAGVVIHGAVRDVDELNSLEIGIKALGAIPLKTDKRGEGQREIEVSFGGIRFVPGHYLVADNNGVIVSPKDIQHLEKS
jgi:regulator of ribonuclease activity A